MTTTIRPDQPPPPNLRTIIEIAERLAVDVRHVRRLVHERRIPFIKWGHLLRFDPDDITAWIQEHRHPELAAQRARRGASRVVEPRARWAFEE